MFVHLNPISGVVEPYSNDIQETLNSTWAGGIHYSSIYLGSKCFHATVFFDRYDKHYQTTPAIQGAKPPGYRQVRRVTNVSTLFQHNTPMGWRFCNSDDLGAQPTVIRMPHARVPSWQWCTVTSISPNDTDWISYNTTLNDDLEEIWTTEGDNFVFVCDTNKRIFVDRSSVFFREEDTATGNTRWVRRILVELSDNRKTQHSEEDVCAICICDFSDDAMTTETLMCNHTFHCACLARLIEKKCPLCRAPIACPILFIN